MLKASDLSPSSLRNESIPLWFLTNFFGFFLSWTFLNAWSPLSWDDEEMLVPVLIALVVSIESLIAILLSQLLIEKNSAISRLPQRLLALTALSTGVWLVSCAGILLFRNVFHWMALLLSALAYLTSILLATAIVYWHWLLYADAAVDLLASDE